MFIILVIGTKMTNKYTLMEDIRNKRLKNGMFFNLVNGNTELEYWEDGKDVCKTN